VQSAKCKKAAPKREGKKIIYDLRFWIYDCIYDYDSGFTIIRVKIKLMKLPQTLSGGKEARKNIGL